MNIPDFTDNIELFNTFGDDFDRFDFPISMRRVTSGHGGESYLITGSEKTAIYDCGMAYCGELTVENIAEALRERSLDYILLSHSHYDHIGALPYIRDRFPDAIVCGSRKCQSVLQRENARKLIEELGTEARDLYTPQSAKPVRTDGLKVDRVLEDGDSISLGDMTITAYETKGHTDCSLTYYIEPAGLLLTSESTGILEGKDYVHTPSLKSFSDSLKSCDKCEALHPAYLCLPHFGMLPKDFNETYFRMFRQECASKTAFVRSMKDEGLDFAQMLARYVDRYWTPAKEMEQPKEAFELNSKHILNALLKEIENV
ncbi:MAG: MBL fold metallo-hydrolase [Bacillota bacterium]|nr:MBL fold metallo-hydrolase [Bacillota bacterium]